MLPEVGGTELIVLAIAALIFVGPKDLPIMMRKIGQWVGKMRGLAAEFRSSFDEMARQSELDELRKEVEALRNTRIPDPLTNLHPTFEEVSAGLDPSGFNIGHSAATEPYAPEITTVESHTPEPASTPPPAEAPKPRARSRKSNGAAEAAPTDAPKPKRASKPRAKPAASAEADG